MADVWKEFKKLPGEQAQCLKCPKIISCKGSSTSGLWRHLKNKHNLQNQRESKSDVVPLKQRKVLDTAEPASSIKQSSLLPFLKRRTLCETVARLAAADGISISAITNSQFIRQAVAERGFKLPRTKTAVMHLVHEFYDYAKKQTMQELTEKIRPNNELVSMSTDEWTSVANKRYLNVNLHFADGSFFNLGLVRIRGAFPAEKIVEAVEQMINGFGLDASSIAAVTSDGASVMVKFGRMVPYFHQLCYNHGLHLAVQDVLYRSDSACETDDALISDSEDSDSDDEEGESPNETDDAETDAMDNGKNIYVSGNIH